MVSQGILRVFALAMLSALGGCTATIPEAQLICTFDSDCPPDWFCRANGRCYATPGDVDGGARDGGPRDAGAPDGAPPSDSGALPDAPPAGDGGAGVRDLDPVETYTGAIGGRFGHAVALSFDHIVVGVPDGVSFGGLYHRRRDGSAEGTALRGVTGDRLGAAVRFVGNGIVAVGAPGEGRVHGFDLATEEFAPASLSGGARYGEALAFDAPFLFVGGPGAGAGAGEVVRHQIASGGWSPSGMTTVTGASGEARGLSLAAHAGSYVMGGAGRAWVVPPSGIESPLPPASAIASFGAAVALDDSFILVADPYRFGGGAVHLYVVDITPTASIFVSEDPMGGDRFGTALCLGPSFLVVGAPGGHNVAYVYERVSVGFELAARLLATDAAAGAEHGFSCAFSGEDILIGAPGENRVRLYRFREP